jgi:hypothetical protein
VALKLNLLIPDVICRLNSGLCTLNHTFIEPRCCINESEWKSNDSSSVALKKFKKDSVYIDKNGKLRNFNHKKLSRKTCNLCYPS